MSYQRRRRRWLLLATASSLTSAISAAGYAAELSWINPAGGSFAVGTNWSGGVVPGATDRPVFNLGSAGYTVEFGPFVATTITDGLLVRTDRVTLDLNHWAYRLGPLTSPEPGPAFVGAIAGDDATLRVLDGGVVCGQTIVGAATFTTGGLASGNLAVGTAALWTSTRRTSVRNGRLDVEHGGRVSTSTNVSTPNTGWFTIGDQGGDGTVRVSGIGSQIDDHATVFVGQSGHGTLVIENGGRYSGFGGQLGYDGGIGHASVRGPGSLWSAAYRSVGDHTGSGSGHMTIANGGLVRQVGPDGDAIQGVVNAGDGAHVEVRDAGSRYQLDAGLSVGSFGAGALTVLDGGVVDAGGMIVGAEAFTSTRTSTVWIDGTGALVNVRGDMVVGRAAPPARVELYNGAALRVGGRLTINPSGTVFVRSDDVHAATLDVRGGTVRLHDSAGAALRVGTAMVSDGGEINLSRGGMVVDYSGASPIASIRALIASAHASGTWDGPGITSSNGDAGAFALGYVDASALDTVPPFFGTVDADAILVRHTRYGDTNLDAQVNLQDFNRLAGHFGSNNAFWSEGDFNYDGSVNLQDFNLLAANFGLSAGGTAVSPQDWAALAAAVPEPTGAGVVGLMVLGLAGRRRRV